MASLGRVVDLSTLGNEGSNHLICTIRSPRDRREDQRSTDTSQFSIDIGTHLNELLYGVDLTMRGCCYQGGKLVNDCVRVDTILNDRSACLRVSRATCFQQSQ